MSLYALLLDFMKENHNQKQNVITHRKSRIRMAKKKFEGMHIAMRKDQGY